MLTVSGIHAGVSRSSESTKASSPVELGESNAIFGSRSCIFFAIGLTMRAALRELPQGHRCLETRQLSTFLIAPHTNVYGHAPTS